MTRAAFCASASALASRFRARRTAAASPLRFLKRSFNSGQDVVPSFDGWLRNADGTFTFVFGYLNRNYKEAARDSRRP